MGLFGSKPLKFEIDIRTDVYGRSKLELQCSPSDPAISAILVLKKKYEILQNKNLYYYFTLGGEEVRPEVLMGELARMLGERRLGMMARPI